jgi:hypothetical protein
VREQQKKSRVSGSLVKSAGFENLEQGDLMAYKQRRFLRSSSRGRLIANTVDTRSNVTKERLISMQALYEQRIKWRNVVGGPYRRSSFVAGTTSVNVERWNKALETIGVPKCKWTQVRERFMRVLLEEHDTILRSYSTGRRNHSTGMEMG